MNFTKQEIFFATSLHAGTYLSLLFIPNTNVEALEAGLSNGVFRTRRWSESLPVTVIGSQAAQRLYCQKGFYNYEVVKPLDSVEDLKGMAMVYIPGVYA